MYIYREAYQKNLTTAEQARMIKRMSVLENGKAEHIAATVIDPSTFSNVAGLGTTVAAQYNAQGVIVTRAKNQRIGGWQNMRRYMMPHPVDGEVRLKIFRTCDNLIRTIPLMRHDQRNPEDLDSRDEDHAVDALRYLLGCRPYELTKKDKKQYTPGAEGRVQKFMEKLDRQGKQQKSRWR
jgi:hypothetical protein